MLYFDFKDYEEFKQRFGIERDEKGKLLRKNKILLSWVTNKALFKECVRRAFYGGREPYKLINYTSMDQVVKQVDVWLGCSCGCYTLCLNENYYYSTRYKTDNMKGIPEDGSLGFIRYQNMEREGKVYKMKAGKMYRHLLDTCDYSELISDKVKIYLCELFTEQWIAYQSKLGCDYTLHVDKNFWKIYDSGCYLTGASFNSCMTDQDYYTFYELIDASAAYITNQDGKIMARCVIYNEVLNDETGEIYRLAERQYAADGNQVYMRQLIDALIREGHIDGYKRIGMGCHDTNAFILNDGTKLDVELLSISAKLNADDTVSYQDSFKWYDPNSKRAYNYENGDFRLDYTEGIIDGTNFDELHEERTFNNVITVRRNGYDYYVDEKYSDDYYFINGYYYDPEDVVQCPECGEMFLIDNGYYSDITDQSYCCDACRADAEERFEKEHEEELRDEEEEEVHLKKFTNETLREHLEAIREKQEAISAAV